MSTSIISTSTVQLARGTPATLSSLLFLNILRPQVICLDVFSAWNSFPLDICVASLLISIMLHWQHGISQSHIQRVVWAKDKHTVWSIRTCMIGWIIPICPQRMSIFSPWKLLSIILYDKGYCPDVIKLRVLRLRHYLKPGMPKVFTWLLLRGTHEEPDSIRQKWNSRNKRSAWSKKEVMNQGMQVASRNWKWWRDKSSPEVSKRNSALPTP